MNRPSPIPSVSPRPPSPSRRDPSTFADRADARFEHDLNIADPELNAIGEAIHQHTDYMESVATQTEQARASANQERLTAQAAANTATQKANEAATSQSLAQSAQSAAESARDATLVAASEVGALILDDAQKVVRRGKAQYFGLNLNSALI